MWKVLYIYIYWGGKKAKSLKIIAWVLKEPHHMWLSHIIRQQAALSSNSGEMGKVQQKDANTNGFCNKLLWVNGSFDKAHVFPKERKGWFPEFKNCFLINFY